ncbi:MAG TPA: hypothetical protein VGV91_01695 [Rubrobacter sp.]|nr:hypothetical protein [Rubrobacter sp.]
MVSHDERLLTDEQLRNASLEQIEDLVQTINLALQQRGIDGLVWQHSRTREGRPTLSAPDDPGTIGSE